ncbi:MAG: flagellar motor protein MotB [Alphaproteobacteria bacterium]
MIPERRRHHVEENTDSWLMSYADMITLLMCFFIIFVSVSEPKRDKFTEITKGIMDKFGTVNVVTPFNGVYNDLQFTIESNQVFRDMVVRHTDQTLEIEVAGNKFFNRDSAELSAEMQGVLEETVKALKSVDYLDYRMTVESHTSDLPPNNPLYPTNWELSTGRAAKLVRFFAEHGLPADRMEAAGFADTRPDVANRDLQGNPISENQEKNERVIIKLERR